MREAGRGVREGRAGSSQPTAGGREAVVSSDRGLTGSWAVPLPDSDGHVVDGTERAYYRRCARGDDRRAARVARASERSVAHCPGDPKEPVRSGRAGRRKEKT